MPKLPVVLAAVLLVCGVSGYAIAQSGGAKPKTIKACAKKKGGALRITKRCGKAERRVTWAMRGPTGQTGPKGQPASPARTAPRGLRAPTGRMG